MFCVITWEILWHSTSFAPTFLLTGWKSASTSVAFGPSSAKNHETKIWTWMCKNWYLKKQYCKLEFTHQMKPNNVPKYKKIQSWVWKTVAPLTIQCVSRRLVFLACSRHSDHGDGAKNVSGRKWWGGGAGG